MFVFMEQTSMLARSYQHAEKARENMTYGWNAPIRRPHRGIQIKGDTYSVISIVKSNGDHIPLVSSSAIVDKAYEEVTKGRVQEFSDYILQRVEDQRMEKQQIIETFGEDYVFFFGERPRIMTFAGLLVNTEDFNWRSQFWHNYENYLRGTKLVQLNARAYITFDTFVVEGFPLMAQASDADDNPYSVPFQLQMLVTNSFDFSNIGSTLFPGKNMLPNIEVMNKELTASRSSFASSGLDVRNFNLFGGDATTSVLEGFRKGISFAKNLEAKGAPWARMAQRVLGGRTVRLPIGVAGYIASVGQAQFAAGSINTSPIVEGIYDRETGRLTTLTGSVKMRMPPEALFAPVDSNKLRTYISENYDEYPTRKQPQKLSELLGFKEYSAYEAMVATQQALKGKRSLALAVWNARARAGSWFGKVAEVVDMVKDGWGMFANSINILKDFENLIPAYFDLGATAASFRNHWNPAKPFGSWESFKFSPYGRLTTQRVSELNRARAVFAPFYIGQKALETFNEMADAIEIDPNTGKPYAVALGEVYNQGDYVPNRPDEASVGEAYWSNDYVPAKDSKEKDYEATYGDNDYTSVLQRARSEAVAPEELYTSTYISQEEARRGEALDPELVYGEKGYISASERARETQATIDEVYGDNDYAENGSEISESEIEDLYDPTGAYRDTYTSQARLSPEERAALLAAAYEDESPPDDTTEGIRGIDEDDADIEPVQ